MEQIHVTHEQLQRFWNALPRERKSVVNQIFKECNFDPENDIFWGYYGNNHVDIVINWLLKQHLIPISSPLGWYEQDQEILLSFLENALISVGGRNEQIDFLIRFITILRETPYDYNPTYIDTVYIVSNLLAQLSANGFRIDAIGGFSLNKLPNRNWINSAKKTNYIWELNDKANLLRLGVAILYSDTMKNQLANMDDSGKKKFLNDFANFFGIPPEDKPAHSLNYIPKGEPKFLTIIKEGWDRYTKLRDK